MSDDVLRAVCEYLRQIDAQRRGKLGDYLVHPILHNSAGAGTVAWAAILRPSVYIEMQHKNGLIALSLRRWLKMSRDDIFNRIQRQLNCTVGTNGKYSVFDRYSHAVIDLVCHCNKCQDAYFVDDNTPHAHGDIEDIESFELADPESLDNIWKSVVKHRYQITCALTDADAIRTRYISKLPR